MFVLLYLNEINKCNIEFVFWYSDGCGCDFWWGWGGSFGFSLIVLISFCDMIFYAILCDFGHTIYIQVDFMNFSFYLVCFQIGVMVMF